MCVVDSAPPRSAAGTMSGVLDRPAGTRAGGMAGGTEDADAGDAGAAAGFPWPEDPEHAVATATTARAASATVKPRHGDVSGDTGPA
jgi:hypothetical protein